MTIFEGMASCRWEIGDIDVTFPSEQVRVSYENRLVAHERAYKNGARVDNTGGKVKVVTVTLAAYNSEWHEPDVDGVVFYPKVLNGLLASFEENGTGRLTVGTIAPIRAQAKSYERVETHEEVDSAAVVLTWWEDSEDDSAAEVLPPNAAGAAKTVAKDAAREAEEQGVNANFTATLRELGSAAETLLTAPESYLGDAQALAKQTAGVVEQVTDTFARTSSAAVLEIHTLLSDPAGSRAARLTLQLTDMIQRAAGAEPTERQPVSRTFDRDLSLYAIATEVGNSPSEVLDLNTHLDAFNVPALTPVLVYV